MEMMILLLVAAVLLWGFASACAAACRSYGGDSFWIGLGVPAAVLAPVFAFVGLVGIVGTLLS